MLAFRVASHPFALKTWVMSLPLFIESAGSSSQAHLQGKAGGTTKGLRPTPRVTTEGLLTSTRSLTLKFSKLCLSLPVFLCVTPAFRCHTFLRTASIKLKKKKNSCYLPAPELHYSISIFNSEFSLCCCAFGGKKNNNNGRPFKWEQLDVRCLRRCELAGLHECWGFQRNFCSFLFLLRLK